MLADGLVEVGFGVALRIDRHTRVVAVVTALSLAPTVGYLGLVTATEAGRFADIAVRDVELTALALAVTVDAIRSPRE